MFRLSYFILRGHVTTVDALMAMYNADSRVLQDTLQWESKRFSMAKQSTYDWYVMSFTVYNSYTYIWHHDASSCYGTHFGCGLASKDISFIKTLRLQRDYVNANKGVGKIKF